MNDGDEGQSKSSAFELQAQPCPVRQGTIRASWDVTSRQDPHSGAWESSAWYGVLVPGKLQ